VAVGDFNNDKTLDIVTANDSNGTVSVLLGNGSGTFQPALNYWCVGQCVGPEYARQQETLRPAGLERSFSRAVDQIAEALPLTAFLFAHGR